MKQRDVNYAYKIIFGLKVRHMIVLGTVAIMRDIRFDRMSANAGYPVYDGDETMLKLNGRLSKKRLSEIGKVLKHAL